jgi:hypothetical protein
MRRNFTPTDDALIRQQPVTGMGLKQLETLLHTNREALMRRAVELTFRWSSVVMIIMTSRPSTRPRSAATMDSSTRHWNG